MKNKDGEKKRTVNIINKDNIDRNTGEITRDIKELEVTIDRIMKDNHEENDDIIDMLNNMIQESKERLTKLQSLYRAAMPTGSGGGECVLSCPISPRATGVIGHALETEATQSRAALAPIRTDKS